MTDDQLLDLCLQVTGTFENGALSYQAVTGDFDGEGISVGVLQWSAGGGGLSVLVGAIAGRLGWARVGKLLGVSAPAIAISSPLIVKRMCQEAFLEPGTHKLSSAGEAAWKRLLSEPEAIQAQRDTAMRGPLVLAKQAAQGYLPAHATNTRVLAFFFDLVNQQGWMHHVPLNAHPDVTEALAYTETQYPEVAAMWREITTTDPLAQTLLYYAFERTRVGRPEFWWDTLSRRGSIACRRGIVHKGLVDFTHLLD